MRPLLIEFGGTLREVNIDEDDELAERYSWDIPVIFVGGRKAGKHRVDLRAISPAVGRSSSSFGNEGK